MISIVLSRESSRNSTGRDPMRLFAAGILSHSTMVDLVVLNSCERMLRSLAPVMYWRDFADSQYNAV